MNPSTAATAAPQAPQWSVSDGVRYGLLGLPLAFCALPLYVLMPNLYAREWGVSLGALGAVLLGARLLDALIDPLLGRLCDRLYATSLRAVLTLGALAACLLGVGFSALFMPLVHEPDALLWWAGFWLVVTFAPTAPCRWRTSPGVPCWGVTRFIAAVWWPGAKGWVCWGCCWQRSRRRCWVCQPCWRCCYWVWRQDAGPGAMRHSRSALCQPQWFARLLRPLHQPHFGSRGAMPTFAVC